MLSQPTGQLSSLDENSVSEGQCIEEEEEDHYFSSYGHFSIHEEMLKVLMAKKWKSIDLSKQPLYFL